MKKMNIGFIGCGGFVQGTHLPNAHKNPHFHIKAVCDLNPQTLASLQKQYACDYVTADFHDIAADDDIEMVVIGTSPSVRIEPIRAAAQHGKHIYVEKPMSLGYDDSAEIIQIIRSAGVKLQVGFNRPCSAIMQQAKRVFHQIAKAPTLISYRIVGEDILWPEFHRRNVKSGESHTIVHEVTHIFDLLNWLIEKEPLKIHAIGGDSDDNIISLVYPNQTTAVILSGSCGTEAYPKERMEVFSDNKVIVMDDFVELNFTRIPGEKDLRFDLKSNPIRNQTHDLSAGQLREDLMVWRDRLSQQDIAKGYYYNSRPCVDKGHNSALEFLFNAIRSGQPTQTNEYRGAVATIMGIEAINSLKAGRMIDLDFTCLR